MNRLLQQLESEHSKPSVPDFGIGDTVDVHYLIKEGDKERVQLFSGIVISLQGSGTRRSATIRRLVAGEGVERTFPLHSPRVADIQVKERGIIRRAKLFYLRGREGKATRIDPNLGARQYPRSIKVKKADKAK
ncbi:MAG: 50S ribosomal protein L19 [Phycisphaerales bacterium]|jgi:large subunit ribosomal protein L19|nr:50S ribosomal protein L19 [Phycisphaerales bacterium]